MEKGERGVIGKADMKSSFVNDCSEKNQLKVIIMKAKCPDLKKISLTTNWYIYQNYTCM